MAPADIILARIRRVPPGFVTTYGDVSPGAPRHTGQVLARLPDGHGVPWWRVVRADGTVVKGERQLARLRREGVPLRGARVDLAAARIPPDAIL